MEVSEISIIVYNFFLKMIDWHRVGPLIVTGVFSFAMLGVTTWNALLLVRDSEKEIKVCIFLLRRFFERSSDSRISRYHESELYDMNQRS